MAVNRDGRGVAVTSPLTQEQRDLSISLVMDKYHHVGPDHIPADDPTGECPECSDIVGMFLLVERYAIERYRMGY